MKKVVKKALSVLVAVVLIFGLAVLIGSFGSNNIIIKAEASTYTGSCGKNLTYYLSSSTGALKIVGDGDMYNYYADIEKAPWTKFYTKVKSVEIGNGVTSIGVDAFRDCEKLASIKISGTVTKIGEGAFSGCSSLENISIPASVTNIECSFGCKVTVDSSNPNYSSDEIGALYNKNKTELISFPTNSEIESYTIPSTVTKLSESVFTCSKFSSVTIPASVTYIDYYAFSDCYNLQNVYYNGSISDWCTMNIQGFLANPMYYADAFYVSGAAIKGTLAIPEGVTAVNGYTFVNCAEISGVTLPKTLKSIGDYAFGGCTGIKNAAIPDGVTELGEGIFSECTLLESAVLPAKITSIKADMFNGCESLKTVNIPLGVTSICARAFENCKNLTIAKYPGDIANWNSVTVGYDNYYLERTLIIDCNSARPHYIPGEFGDGLTWTLYTDGEILISGSGKMPDYEGSFDAPWHNKKSLIKAVAFSDGITDIGAGTFTGFGNITSVTVPKSVKIVGLSAFGNCDNLAHIYYAGSKSEWNSITVAEGNDKFKRAKIHYDSNAPAVEPSPVPDEGFIKTPSKTTIQYGDSIVLHANMNETLPIDWEIKWTVSNGSFDYKISTDGTTCTITPKSKGDTTFTATLYDAKGNVVSSGEQTMTSKAGFFNKIIGFFRKLFGLTEIYDR